MWWLLVACATPSPDEAPPPAPPTPLEAPPPSEPPPLYVVASELRLRAGPSTDSEVEGRLSINSPVTPGVREGDFTRVTVGSGAEGWVSTAFLRATPLTLEEALSEARATGDLSWWQRAAAVDSASREALVGLEAAYRAADRPQEAERVAQQLAWPHEVAIVARSRRVDDWGRHDTAVVQWQVGGGRGEGGLLPEATWRARGIPDTWTVLADLGPPVPATVREVWAGSHNECSGTYVVEVVLDVRLTPGRVPLAASRGAVPASWAVDGPPPALPRADALARVAREAAKVDADVARHGVARVGTRWRGRILSGVGEPGEPWTVVEGWVEGETWVPDARSEGEDLDGFLELGRRDVDGDGVVERILGDGCMTVALPEGATERPGWEAITDPWCCGC